MSKVRLGRLVAGLAIAAVAVPAAAYQIGSGSLAKKSRDLHESFTAAARTCLKNKTEERLDCSAYLKVAVESSEPRKADASNDETYVSRWPDDPTRMLDTDPSKIRFGLQLKKKCKKPLRRGPAINRVGLLCASHFGRLQFMHAQSTADEEGPAQTRLKILAWANFAYRAATDRSFRDTDYCNAVDGITEPGLKDALTLDDRRLCDDRTIKVMGITKHFTGWNVATLFGMRCPNPVQVMVCWERNDDDDTPRMAALGALLHLVQDSYSQSHVIRTAAGQKVPGPRGPFTRLVVCRRPSGYYDYVEQNMKLPGDDGVIRKDPHAAADFPPGLDRGSCEDPAREVDDVITASAMVLHFVDHPDAQAFETYMSTRVFPG